VNPQIDPNNCSSCGNVCPSGDSCSSGSCVCTYSTCNGACVDLQTNPGNCGTCGHSCLGGTCVGGSCQPYTVASGARAQDLALDASNVYWTDYSSPGGVRQCTIANCTTPITLASGQNTPDRIAVDGSYVYWTNYGSSGSVMRCAIGTQCGSSATVLASAVDATGIALDAANVYWTMYQSTGMGGVYACSKVGCGGTPTPITTSTTYGYFDIAQINGGLYWTYNGGVLSCPTSGCTGAPNPVTPMGMSGVAPYYIAVDTVDAYFTNGLPNYPVDFCSLSGSSGVATIASTANGYAITVDATYVYWTDITAQAVLYAPLGGGTPSTLYHSSTAYPLYVKQNAIAICWTASDNSVMCRAR